MELETLQRNGLVTTLYPWEVETAYRIGKSRNQQNISKTNRHSYDASRLMSDNEIANVHSVMAEIGVCRLIGAYCYCAIWDMADHDAYKELPDGLWGITEIEIKWRRTAFSMPVDLKDAERNRLVLWAEVRMAGCSCEQCASNPPRTENQVRLLGGGYARELWGLGKAYNGDPNRVSVHVDKISPISALLAR